MWRKYFTKLPTPLRRFAFQLLAPVRRVVWRLRRHPRYFEESDRRTFFRKAFYALHFNEIDGDYCEFGCHTGLTFGLAYRESRRIGYTSQQWAFDSFAGMPEHVSDADDHPSWKPGGRVTTVPQFRDICARNGIGTEEYTIVQGFYNDTLTDAASAAGLPSNVALAYIDCDLYSSTAEVLRFLSPRLKNGMIVAFDDYFCWSRSGTSGERKALLEFAKSHPDWSFVPYARFGWAGQSFVVESAR
jgi:hypothetical protein